MKNQHLYIEDAIEQIETIENKLKKVKKADFFEDSDLQDSVVLRIIYLGEALGRISESYKDKHQQVDWQKAIGMRNRLAHDYGEVDMEIVWGTVKNDLPVLKRQLAEI